VADRVDVAQRIRRRGDLNAGQYVVGVDLAEFVAIAGRQNYAGDLDESAAWVGHTGSSRLVSVLKQPTLRLFGRFLVLFQRLG
jgi:hypothetical protein